MERAFDSVPSWILHTGQLSRERLERRREFVGPIENDRTAFVHRLKRKAVVARDHVADLEANRALDVVKPDLSAAIGPGKHDLFDPAP